MPQRSACVEDFASADRPEKPGRAMIDNSEPLAPPASAAIQIITVAGLTSQRLNRRKPRNRGPGLRQPSVAIGMGEHEDDVAVPPPLSQASSALSQSW
jgi:hypothetical protein